MNTKLKDAHNKLDSDIKNFLEKRKKFIFFKESKGNGKFVCGIQLFLYGGIGNTK